MHRCRSLPETLAVIAITGVRGRPVRLSRSRRRWVVRGLARACLLPSELQVLPEELDGDLELGQLVFLLSHGVGLVELAHGQGDQEVDDRLEARPELEGGTT